MCSYIYIYICESIGIAEVYNIDSACSESGNSNGIDDSLNISIVELMVTLMVIRLVAEQR